MPRAQKQLFKFSIGRAFRCAALALAGCGVFLAGCSEFEQVQYFEVVGPPDPITGLTTRSYYRMTVTGNGRGVEEYKMRAAYLSSSALDTLDGKIPTIPAADMDENRRTYFKAIRAAYLRTAQARAEELASRYADGAMDPQQFDQVMTEISRAVWAVTLSDSDLASLGQVRSVDPFEFRKLVFYASARAVALDRYNAQVDSAIQKTNALANLFDRSRVQRETTANEALLEKARAVHQLGEQIQALEDRKAQLENDRGAIALQQTPYKEDLLSVQAEQAAQASEKDALTDVIAGLQAELGAALDDDEKARLQRQLDGANLRLATYETTINSLNTRAEYLTGRIKTLQDEIDRHDSDIKQLQTDLQALTDSLGQAIDELNQVAQASEESSDETDDTAEGPDPGNADPPQDPN